MVSKNLESAGSYVETEAASPNNPRIETQGQFIARRPSASRHNLWRRCFGFAVGAHGCSSPSMWLQCSERVKTGFVSNECSYCMQSRGSGPEHTNWNSVPKGGPASTSQLGITISPVRSNHPASETISPILILMRGWHKILPLGFTVQ